MTGKELRKLSSKQMLKLIAEQTENANWLEQENERLKKRIADREQHLAQMGELAKTILNSSGDLDAEAIGAGGRPITVKVPFEVPNLQDGKDEANGDGAKKDEYRIYKVFNAAVGETGISYTLVDGKTDVPEGSHFTLKNGYVVHDGTTCGDGRLTDEDIKAIAAYVDGDRPYKTVPITSDDSEAVSVEPGYYYITTASGSVVMVGSTDPYAAAAEEVEAPGVTMAVTGGGSGGMADEDGNIMIQAGAAAHFEVTIDVNKGALNYRLIDTMDKRLRLENDSLAVHIVERDGRRSALDRRYWSKSWDTTTDPNHDILTVAFYEDDDHKGAVPKNVARIIAAYDAAAGDALLDGAANSATVEYNGNTAPASTVKVYNAKVTVSTVEEVEENGQKVKAPLAGASFMLGKEPVADGAFKYYYVYDEAAGKVRWTDTPRDAAVVAANTGTDKNQAEFTGLEAGTYYLIEKAVPAGYNKSDDLKFEIKGGDHGSGNLKRKVDFINSAGVKLPSAGGMDTSTPTVGGRLHLRLGSTELVIRKKRRGGG